MAVAIGPSVTAFVDLTVPEIRTFPAHHKEKGDRAFPRLEALKFVRSGKGLAAPNRA
jgi:hypothetical protein